jgi:uncharacterized phage protein (TIGR01671 family)
MRLIKFKAWDKVSKEMKDWDWCKQDNLYQLSIPQENTSFIWLQFTGLLDKNDKEIYEGDIVEWEDDICGEITMGKKMIQTDVRYNMFYAGYTPFTFGSKQASSNECEVIGNIYENPKLPNGQFAYL